MGFAVTLADDTVELVLEADSFALEGPLTTFFSVERGRQARLDAWSTKLLSIRTDHIVKIQRLEADVIECLSRPRPGPRLPRAVSARAVSA